MPDANAREESEHLPPAFAALRDFWERFGVQSGLSARAQALVFCLAFLVVVSHRPDALRNPQFYAEDGKIWFAQAFNFGWLHALLLPQNGYFQTLPRLAAALALLAPLRWAPLVMNLLGLLLQVLPITLLLSSRLANWAPLPLRSLWALTYLVLPNTIELEASVTEGQWHLALLACMIVLAAEPSSRRWWAFDVAVITLSGLTGPFCIFLLPVAIIYYALRRERWRLVPIVLLALTSLVELFPVIRTATLTRSQAPLGVSANLLAELLAGRVYMAALWGSASLAAQQHLAVVYLMALIGTLFLVYCLLKAPAELRLLVAFCLLLFGLSLWHPMASAVAPQWPILTTAAGQHYWFLPTLAFVWSLIWCCFYAPFWLANGAKLLALTLPLGVVNDWRYPAYIDMHYPTYVEQFKTTKAAAFVIPLFPPGWEMTLLNQSAACPALPEGFLDTPKNGAVVAGMTAISGWVVASGQHLKEITVAIDGKLLPPVPPSLVRADVDAIHPESPDRAKGWVTYYDMSRLAPGKHLLQVWAAEQSKCGAQIGQAEIERR